jgi:ribosomal-protein-alanine N-acetyltransferase
MKEFETERLILRKVTTNDLDDLFNNWGSDSNTTKYLTFKTHTNKEDTMKFINNWINKYEKGGLEWAIELKENHQVIGVISADKNYQYKCVEIGYSISSKYWNKGLITEAMKEVVNYLLNECDFNVVEAIIPSNNIGSINVAEKCGLTLEATLKNRYLDKDNNLQDLLVYSRFK